MDRLFGAVQQLLGMGNQPGAQPDVESEAEKARKKRQQMQQQQGMTPWSGAANSLLSRAGNQF